MSDMHVDNLNNSQLLLLVLLISLVVSAATAVATLSAVYGRLPMPSSADAAQPTVIRQTINRIIEREPALPAAVEPTVTSEQHAAEEAALTLEDIENALVRLYFGSQPAAYGIYISSAGQVLVTGSLDTQRRYSVPDKNGQPVFFSVAYSNKEYSLVTPIDTHVASHFVPLEQRAEVLLGQSVLLFSGAGENAQLHTGIVSQVRTTAETVSSFRVSVNPSDITDLSVVFIENKFAGFAQPYTNWISLPSPDVISRLAEPARPESLPNENETSPIGL